MRQLLITLALTLTMSICLAQEDRIISDKSEYEYLIGQTYSDVNELDGFDFVGRMSKTTSTGYETSSTVLINNKVQIYTSEIVKTHVIDEKQYTIVDLIVLNGKFASCEDCFTTQSKNVTIKTIHHRDDRAKKNILLAYSKNNDTGIYERISTDGLSRNPNVERLIGN